MNNENYNIASEEAVLVLVVVGNTNSSLTLPLDRVL